MASEAPAAPSAARSMTPAQHRALAEVWLATADEWAERAGDGRPDWPAVLAATARAQVHATLSLGSAPLCTAGPPW